MVQLKKDFGFLLISIIMIGLFLEIKDEMNGFIWFQMSIVAFAVVWKGIGIVKTLMKRGKSKEVKMYKLL